MAEAEVTVLQVRCPAVLASKLSAKLFDAGADGVEERALDVPSGDANEDLLLVVYGSKGALASCCRYLDQAFADTDISYEEVCLSPDWAWRWTHFLEPVPIGDALTLHPIPSRAPGETVTAPSASDDKLWLATGLAFGYGEHPTTRMAGQWLAGRCEQGRVLDFGTGTGVLALIALRFGAREVIGTDIDLEALRIAEFNAATNSLEGGCRFLSAPLQQLKADFDVVVANVDAATLISHGPALLGVLASGGDLLLTGVTNEQTEPLCQTFAELGVALTCIDEDHGWVLLHGVRARLA